MLGSIVINVLQISFRTDHLPHRQAYILIELDELYISRSSFDHFCSLLHPQKPLTSFSHNLLFRLLFLLTDILTNFSIRGIISSFPPKSFYLFSFILLYFQSNFSLLLNYYYRQSSIKIFKDIVLATWSPSGNHLYIQTRLKNPSHL